MPAALIVPQTDPLDLFADWLEQARAHEPSDPEAMVLATVGADGQPSARMVLLKGHDAAGFVFYTNLQSHKGRQLAECSRAALLFHWKSLRWQVRIEGAVSPVSSGEADAYFATRPREAQIGAWASRQSAPLDSPATLQEAVAVMTQRFAGGPVPRPPHWSGYRLAPRLMEFWQEQPFRLHDRVVYTRTPPSLDWTHARRYP